MVNSEYAERLREKAASLPLSPGIYIMHGADGGVIYVGKSKVIRNRVSQYFHESDFQSPKTDKMTSLVADFEYILCDTEMEALTLENSLIKLYRPKYNIKLKDDKSYPYIKVSGGDYPRFTVTRSRTDGGIYYGPYSSIAAAYDIVKSLARTFGLSFCKREFPRDIGKVKLCLYLQLGCCAPCTGKLPPEEYQARVLQARSFLSGKTDSIIKELTDKMRYASDNLLFEAAARFRDRINAVKKLDDRQKVVTDSSVERDVIAFYEGENITCACVMYIRSGKLIDSERFEFSASEILDSSAVASFIYELYLRRDFVPRELLISRPDAKEELEDMRTWLSQKAGRAVNIRFPERGECAHLIDMALENARQYAEEYVKSSEKSVSALVSLAKMASLEVVPERIEAFDISNYGSELAKGGMVVFEHGKPKKSDYRIFNIKSVVSDDYGAMRETLSRHLAHIADDGEPMPDLLLIDGGEAHLNTVLDVLDGYASIKPAIAAIPVLGMVKDEHHKTRALVSPEGEITFGSYSDVYSLVYRIQEEVHRYTVGQMTKGKRKKEITSVLTGIKGVGKARAALMLTKFGGLGGIKEATAEQLTQIPGITPRIAEDIIEYLKKEIK